ncbi:MarR family transcriptional regulator [Candidatus Gracilibacteria bacterium]|nr:MarR family transcriptional regulator [Candidatus Gracilibacteria bacterium]
MSTDERDTTYAQLQHQLFHDIHMLLNDGDRRVLQALDLSPLEFAVLQRLDVAQGRRLTDIGAELLVVKSTITRVVDRLEHAGLIARSADREDRRAQRLTLTAQGVQLRLMACSVHNTAVERRMALLSHGEHHQLQHLLSKLRAGLAADLKDALHAEQPERKHGAGPSF